MAKLVNDKYYTPIKLANYCWNKVDELIGLNNVSYIIEPSVGNGSFCNYKRKPDICYDIEPELKGYNIVAENFLTCNEQYKEHSLIIGNPPYGEKSLLIRKFFNKAITLGDYIAFILPINQLNNTQSLYQFDLLYSEDLGMQDFSDRTLHCCFNIYKRPKNGLNKLHKETLKGLTIYRQDKKNYKDIKDYDVRICYWGNGSVGKILSENDKDYAGEYKIKISSERLDKEKIVNFIKTFNWKEYLTSISAKRLKQFELISIIKEQLNIKE